MGKLHSAAKTPFSLSCIFRTVVVYLARYKFAKELYTMSQQKVDNYKKKKANRERDSRKERRVRKLELAIVGVLIAAGIIWLVIAGVTTYTKSHPTTITINTEAIDTYVNSLDAGQVEEG